MGLRQQMLELPLDGRLSYDSKTNTFFVNFEGLRVRDTADVTRIRHAVESRLLPIGKQVIAIVNYDHFDIAPEVMDAYAEMVRVIADRHYSQVTRYTASTFLRARLAGTSVQDQVPPNSE